MRRAGGQGRHRSLWEDKLGGPHVGFLRREPGWAPDWPTYEKRGKVQMSADTRRRKRNRPVNVLKDHGGGDFRLT